MQDRFELKKADGTYITEDALYDMAKEAIVGELDCMDNDDAIRLGNEIRADAGYDLLHENKRSELNEVLEDEEPYDILTSGWDDCSDFFVWDGSEFDMTDDVWTDLDTDEIACDMMDGSYSDYITSDIRDILDDWEEAKDFLENLNLNREEGRALLAKFTNCEADVTDLLQYIDKLVRNDEVWEE